MYAGVISKWRGWRKGKKENVGRTYDCDEQGYFSKQKYGRQREEL
jgi:hypothetical protein